MPYQNPKKPFVTSPSNWGSRQKEQKTQTTDAYAILSDSIDSISLRAFILSEAEQNRYKFTDDNLKKLKDLNKQLSAVRWPFKRRKAQKLLHSAFSLPNRETPVISNDKVDTILREYDKLRTQTSARLSSRLVTSIDKTTTKKRFKRPSRPGFLKRTKQKPFLSEPEPLKEKFERQIQLYEQQVKQAFERTQTKMGTLKPDEILESATVTLESILSLFHNNDIEAQKNVCKPLKQQHEILVQRLGDLSNWYGAIIKGTEFVEKNSGRDGHYISPVLNAKENEEQRLTKSAMYATQRHWKK